jgi:hypothetical protein
LGLSFRTVNLIATAIGVAEGAATAIGAAEGAATAMGTVDAPASKFDEMYSKLVLRHQTPSLLRTHSNTTQQLAISSWINARDQFNILRATSVDLNESSVEDNVDSHLAIFHCLQSGGEN